MSQRFITFSGIVLVAVLFFAVNVVSDTLFRTERIDLTENRLFTLSDGTRQVLRNLPEPITLKLYYSSQLASQVPEIRTHANRVIAMLEEFRNIAGSKIRLEIVEPEPFSEAEDRAVDAGLSGVPLGGSGDNFYLGLVGENTVDDQQTIGFFQPERDRFLEYDLARMVYSLAHPVKPKLMVVSDYPLLFGPGGMQAAMMGQSRAYGILEPMRQLYEVDLPVSEWTEIDKDTDLLVLIHARHLTDQQLYAIDQYIMNGGRALILADPFSETAASLPSAMGPNPADTHDSLLPKLFDAWGVRIEPGKLVADRALATRVSTGQGRRQIVDYVAWLQAAGPALNAEDPVTADLSLPLLLPSVGHIEPAKDSRMQVTPLVTSTKQSELIGTDEVRFRADPERLLADFKADERSYVLAARLHGPVKSAFDGPPEGVKAEHKAASDGPVDMIVVADADMVDDRYWLQRQQLFGQELTQQSSANGQFLLNAIDNLGGASGLIGLRSRGEGDRPFTVMEDLRRQAEQRYLAEEQRLQERLSETEQKLAELQSQAGEGGSQLLSAEQAGAIESFQNEMLQTRQQLRNVQHSLREDIEALQNRIRLIDIGLMPAVVFVAAIGLALYRRQRRKASQSLREA